MSGLSRSVCISIRASLRSQKRPKFSINPREISIFDRSFSDRREAVISIRRKLSLWGELVLFYTIYISQAWGCGRLGQILPRFISHLYIFPYFVVFRRSHRRITVHIPQGKLLRSGLLLILKWSKLPWLWSNPAWPLISMVRGVCLELQSGTKKTGKLSKYCRWLKEKSTHFLYRREEPNILHHLQICYFPTPSNINPTMNCLFFLLSTNVWHICTKQLLTYIISSFLIKVLLPRHYATYLSSITSCQYYFIWFLLATMNIFRICLFVFFSLQIITSNHPQDSMAYHQICETSGGNSVSLHVYSPPIKDCLIFDEVIGVKKGGLCFCCFQCVCR